MSEIQKRPPPKRKAAKISKGRQAIKLEETKKSPLDAVFGGIVPPRQAHAQEGLTELIPANISEEELKALQQINFGLWVATSKIEVDHKPFDFNSHQYLLPMYFDRAREFVLMKSAQMGATILCLLKALWFCIYHPVKACFYFPTDKGVGTLSKDRLSPLIHSNGQLTRFVQETDTLGYKQIGDKSALYLQHIGGEATKDSTPFDFLLFDEVRLMKSQDIDQTKERISHSIWKWIMMVSTAGYPGADIDRQFKRGTQNYFHTRCGCPDGVILSEVWPDCLIATEKECYYRCPRCKMRIQDPQNGRFIPHNPGADISSYHIHQMLSRFISPAEIWNSFQTTTNLKEFFNAKLGKPYVDEENVPVTIDDLHACERTDISWGERSGKRTRIGMGVDQMSGNNYVVIAELTENKKRILHFEIIDSMNSIYHEEGQRVTPFKRLYQLMEDFDVDLCIVDAMPNVNEATDFARTFPKRVFVSWYVDSHGGTQGRDMVQWGDRVKEKQSVRRGGPKIKFKYTCVLNRYMTIDFSMSEVAQRHCEWPVPGRLIQVCRSLETGRFEPLHIMRTHFYFHMTKIVRQKTIIDEDTGRFRMEWVNLGIDPHTVHAWNYCNIALERLRKIPIMTFA